ncbi:hypothetical protein [Reyranella sp.]
MAILTENMKRLIAEQKLGFGATAGELRRKWRAYFDSILPRD